GTVERQRERLLLGHPERQVERRFEPRCSTAPLLGADGVTISVSEERSGLKRCVYVALHLAQRDRQGRQVSVGVVDPVERVFPALIDQSAVGMSAVLHEPVTIDVPVLEDPRHSAVSRRQQRRAVSIGKGAPPVELGKEHNEKSCCVGGSVVGGPYAQRQGRLSSQTNLVQDTTRLLFRQRIDPD